MASAPPERSPMMNALCLFFAFLLLPSSFILLPSSAAAQERHALIIAGATGGAVYAVQYRQWTEQLSGILIDQLKFDPAHIVSLSETDKPEAAATAANVRR